jgi:hypothetical protein
MALSMSWAPAGRDRLQAPAVSLPAEFPRLSSVNTAASVWALQPPLRELVGGPQAPRELGHGDQTIAQLKGVVLRDLGIGVGIERQHTTMTNSGGRNLRGWKIFCSDDAASARPRGRGWHGPVARWRLRTGRPGLHLLPSLYRRYGRLLIGQTFGRGTDAHDAVEDANQHPLRRHPDDKRGAQRLDRAASGIDDERSLAPRWRRERPPHLVARLGDVRCQREQRLRSAFEPLQSRENAGLSLATELALALVDAELLITSLALQHAACTQAAGDMMYLCPLRAGLTAGEGELSLADPDDFFDWRTDAREPPHLGCRRGQAIGGVVRLAVSDHPSCEASAQPANFGPIRVSPMLTYGVAIEAAMLLHATHEGLPIVPNPFEQTLGGIPGITEPRLGTAAPAVVGVAESLERHVIRRGAPFVPEAQAQRESHGPIRPDQADEGQPIDWLMVSAGIHPCQALDCRRKRFGHHGVIEDERAPPPDEPCAAGQLQESLPGPVRLQPSRQAVMGHRLTRLCQGDTTRRGAIIQEGGEVVPNQRWQRVPSFVAVGWALYAISSPLRNP